MPTLHQVLTIILIIFSSTMSFMWGYSVCRKKYLGKFELLDWEIKEIKKIAGK